LLEVIMGVEFEDINGSIVRNGWTVEILSGPMAGSVGPVTGMRGVFALVDIDGREVEVDPSDLLLKDRRRAPELRTQRL
jgi:hypothetical protein